MISLDQKQHQITDLLNGDLSEVAEATRDALVRVVSGGHGMGSGVVWSDDGIVVTNAHVVGNDGISVVTSAGHEVAAQLLLRDANTDVAVLKIEGVGLSAAPLGDARRLKAGEMVFAFGYPWGISAAITAGVVLEVGDREDTASGTDRQDWLTVNMRLRPGNSGGPVVNARGQVVGLSTAMTGPQIGLAIPAHIVDAVVASTLVKQP